MNIRVELLLIGFICQIVNGGCNGNSKQVMINKISDYQIQTLELDSGWGYEISTKGKPYIRQETIPAISGNKGFSSKEKAEKAAQFVVFKMEKNIMPPTVTVTELDSLGILD